MAQFDWFGLVAFPKGATVPFGKAPRRGAGVELCWPVGSQQLGVRHALAGTRLAFALNL